MPNKTFLSGAFLLGTTLLTGCGVIPGTSVTTVEPGYAGLKIELYGGQKGIENATLVNGRVWFNGYTEDVVIFPTFVNTYPFTKNTSEGAPVDESVVFSVGGSPVSADIGVSFGFSTDVVSGNETKLHQFYKTYRKTPEQFRANDLRNGLRSCFSSQAERMGLTPSDLSTNQQNLFKEVQKCLSLKFPVINITDVSLLGPLRLPPDIQKSINDRFTSQQAALTAASNQKKIEAEAASNVAKAKGEALVTIEQARAEAEANRLRAQSINPQLIELERLKVERERIAKWNGQQATVVQTSSLQLSGVSK